MAFVKRAYGRTKQKTLQTVGRRDATVDIGFNQQLEQFKSQYKIMDKFVKDLREYIKAFKVLSVAQTSLNEGIDSFYDHTSTLANVNESNKKCAIALDVYRQSLDENIDRDVIAPINAHMGVYKTIKKRIAERDRRVTDYDRFKAEVRVLTTNPGTKPEKLHEAQHRQAVAKHAFEVLEQELMRDMEALHNDRLSFFDPCFATILRMQHGYYAEGDRLFGDLAAMVAHIDPSSIHSHVEPITPEELTTANPKNVVPPDPEPYSAPTSQYGGPQRGNGQPQAGAYGAPQGGGYGAPQGGGYGAPQGGGYGAPQGGGYGAPQGGGYGAPQGGGYGAPQGGGVPQGGYAGAPRGNSQYGNQPTQPLGRGAPGPAPRGPAPAPSGKTARGLYPFTAQNASELSFNPGDVLTILSQDGDWWTAQMGGRTGLIPGNYVQLL